MGDGFEHRRATSRLGKILIHAERLFDKGWIVLLLAVLLGMCVVALGTRAPVLRASDVGPPGRRQVVAYPQGAQRITGLDGEQVYERYCVTCHQGEGQGVPGVFPPLSGSEWVTGDKGRLIRILLHGMRGPVEVKGTSYGSVMPPWKEVLSDQKVAEVATYLRTSWGNEASAVSTSEVQRVRAATRGRAEPWTAEALKAEAHTGIPRVEPGVEVPPSDAEATDGAAREDVATGATAEEDAGTAERKADLPVRGSFEKVVLVEDVTRPNMLDVAPDGRVFFIEREGAVRVWDPETRSTSMFGFISVKAVHTSGLLGMVLDPDFQRNRWIYLYYSPRGDDAKNVLARFTIADNRIEPASKRVVLEVPTKRYIEQAHSAGSLAFGPDGNLFLSTGDHANPTEVQLYAPIDERPGREDWDAQRTSANTNSLQGKILRIRPQPDGTYEIPDGNLFPEGTRGRREIYVMGNRNPYRISVDPKTGWLYWGDVGPGAPTPSEERGPKGYDEFNQAREAGNYGWPYFVADNQPYRAYNFATGESGPYYDPNAPVNDSPNNTGARVLPPAQPPLIWYPHGRSEQFPKLGAGGEAAMAGPVYRYDAETVGAHGLPASFEGSLFVYDFMRNWIMEVELDEEGDLLEITPFLPEMEFKRPMDMDIGPEGALYVIEWGTDYEGWYNDDAKIIRLDYYETKQRPPVARASAEPTSGAAPLQVRFSGIDSHGRNGEGRLRYTWDFDGNGVVDSRQANSSFTFEAPGVYDARLTVTDAKGMSATTEIPISVGNTTPSISIPWPVEGGIFTYGEPIPYRIAVEDPEDQPVAGKRVWVQPKLGHDAHTHRLARRRGAAGTFQVLPDETHMYLEAEVAVLEACYTDEGASVVEARTACAHTVLQPRRKQAEHATPVHGAKREVIGSLRVRRNVHVFQVLEDGDYLSYTPVNLLNIESLTFRVAPVAGGTIEVRLDNPGGRLLAEARVDAAAHTAASQGTTQEVEAGNEDAAGEKVNWTNITVPVSNPGGTHELFLVFRGKKEATLMKLDWIEFNGIGMHEPGR